MQLVRLIPNGENFSFTSFKLIVNHATPVVVKIAVRIIWMVVGSSAIRIPGTPMAVASTAFLVAGMYFWVTESSIIPDSFGFGSSSKSPPTWFLEYHSNGVSRTFMIDCPVLFSIPRIFELRFLFSRDSGWWVSGFI